MPGVSRSTRKVEIPCLPAAGSVLANTRYVGLASIGDERLVTIQEIRIAVTRRAYG